MQLCCHGGADDDDEAVQKFNGEHSIIPLR